MDPKEIQARQVAAALQVPVARKVLQVQVAPVVRKVLQAPAVRADPKDRKAIEALKVQVVLKDPVVRKAQVGLQARQAVMPLPVTTVRSSWLVPAAVLTALPITPFLDHLCVTTTLAVVQLLEPSTEHGVAMARPQVMAPTGHQSKQLYG